MEKDDISGEKYIKVRSADVIFTLYVAEFYEKFLTYFMNFHAMKEASADEVYESFHNATTLTEILESFKELCHVTGVEPDRFPKFYPKIRAKLKHWRALDVFRRLDARVSHDCYNNGNTCHNLKVLVIGGGPCGLRAAIEAQLLGAQVVIIEKRSYYSRNNVLQLWPFVMQDLRALGAKELYSRFCSGGVHHISIKKLQMVLLKVALLFGVKFYKEVTFVDLIEPSDETGWRASVLPRNHPVREYVFDCIIGADGRQNNLQKWFGIKEFRGKLAIAISANFENKQTSEDARVPEIPGKSYIYYQQFFKDLCRDTGINLENIVYFKNETHYFVMTAKKQSLLSKGVLLKDYPDSKRLLSPENVDQDALQLYARDAADYATDHQLPHCDFAVTHRGAPDIAIFDFTSMYSAEHSCRMVERKGRTLLMQLVGDSLLQPFWPSGTGCPRGFLSAMDACWMMRQWCCGYSPLQCIKTKEMLYSILTNVMSAKIKTNYSTMTLDPATRYCDSLRNHLTDIQVQHLYDREKKSPCEKMKYMLASINMTYEEEENKCPAGAGLDFGPVNSINVSTIPQETTCP